MIHEQKVPSGYSIEGFGFMMDLVLKNTLVVHRALPDHVDSAVQRIMNVYEITCRKLCAMKRIEELKRSRMNN